MSNIKLLPGILLVIALSCSSLPDKEHVKELSTLSKSRVGTEITWRNTSEADLAVQKEVQKILTQTLDEKAVVRLALLNNPELQAKFDKLGAAVADIWQAGLLKNPSVELSALFPVSGGAPHVGAGLELNLTDLFLRSARKKMAEVKALEMRQIAAQAIQQLAYEARAAFIHLQTGLHKFTIEKLNFDTAEQSIVMHRRLHQAGNISDLELAIEEANFSEIRSALQQAEIELRLEKENLNRIMGFWGSQTKWTIAEVVQPISENNYDYSEIEALALKNRNDLLALVANLEYYRTELKAFKNIRWLPSVSAGGHIETEDAGTRIGPALRFEIPVFDQGNARIEKTVHLYRMKLRELENLAVNIRADVRIARDKMIAARQQVMFYHKQILPQRAKATHLMQLQYNAMLAGIFHLITARQNQLRAEKDYLDFHKNYYLAAAELERAAGLRLESIKSKGNNNGK